MKREMKCLVLAPLVAALTLSGCVSPTLERETKGAAEDNSRIQAESRQKLFDQIANSEQVRERD